MALIEGHSNSQSTVQSTSRSQWSHYKDSQGAGTVSIQTNVIWSENSSDYHKPPANHDLRPCNLPQPQGKIHYLFQLSVKQLQETVLRWLAPAHHTSAVQFLWLVCWNPGSSLAAIFKPFIFFGLPNGRMELHFLSCALIFRTGHWFLSSWSTKVKLYRKFK